MSAPAIVPARSRIDAAPPYVLALFRIVIGLLFTCHGAAGLFNVFGGVPGGQPSVGAWPGWWASLIEFVCGLLVLFGVGTRVAALLCSGEMAYAYFTVHAEHALLPMQNGGEPATLYCWSFLMIAAFGSGAWSLRNLVAPRSSTTTASTVHSAGLSTPPTPAASSAASSTVSATLPPAGTDGAPGSR